MLETKTVTNGRPLRDKYEGKIMKDEVKTKLDFACRGLSPSRQVLTGEIK
jgi:hypothetical protein